MKTLLCLHSILYICKIKPNSFHTRFLYISSVLIEKNVCEEYENNYHLILRYI